MYFLVKTGIRISPLTHDLKPMWHLYREPNTLVKIFDNENSAIEHMAKLSKAVPQVADAAHDLFFEIAAEKKRYHSLKKRFFILLAALALSLFFMLYLFSRR